MKLADFRIQHTTTADGQLKSFQLAPGRRDMMIAFGLLAGTLILLYFFAPSNVMGLSIVYMVAKYVYATMEQTTTVTYNPETEEFRIAYTKLGWIAISEVQVHRDDCLGLQLESTDVSALMKTMGHANIQLAYRPVMVMRQGPPLPLCQGYIISPVQIQAVHVIKKLVGALVKSDEQQEGQEQARRRQKGTKVTED